MDSRAKTSRSKGAVGSKPVLRKWLADAVSFLWVKRKIGVQRIIDLGAGDGSHLALWEKTLDDQSVGKGIEVWGTDLPEVVAQHMPRLTPFSALCPEDNLTHDHTLVISSNVINVQENLKQLRSLIQDAAILGRYWLINIPKSPRKLGEVCWEKSNYEKLINCELWAAGWNTAEGFPETSCPVWLLERKAQ